jgi:serine/threonine-protein kinase HipA
LPTGEAPSSHILKFSIPAYRHAPAYEAVLTELARRTGLQVCNVAFRVFDVGDRSNDCLIVERFDRIAGDDGQMVRLHQEDFCQAFGLGPERKYEEDGGVEFAACVRLVRDVSVEPALDVVQLLRWQIFNVLAGNSDGHSKNVALLYHPDGTLRLAPFYDLVCTRAVQGIDERLAFAVGSERRPDVVTAAHWSRLAADVAVRATYVVRMVREVAGQILAELSPVVGAFQDRHGPYPALQRVMTLVRRQCEGALSGGATTA